MRFHHSCSAEWFGSFKSSACWRWWQLLKIWVVSVTGNAVWLQTIWLKTHYVLFSWESKKFEVSRKDYGFPSPPWSVQNEFPNSIWMTPMWFRQMVLLASWVHNFPWKEFLARTVFIPNLGFLFSNKNLCWFRDRAK